MTVGGDSCNGSLIQYCGSPTAMRFMHRRTKILLVAGQFVLADDKVTLLPRKHSFASRPNVGGTPNFQPPHEFKGSGS